MKYDILHSGGRGVRGQILFKKRSDFLTFLGLVVRFSQELGVRILAYCLMTNHYHLLLAVPQEVRTTYFKKLNGTWAKIFNTLADESGHVFDPRCWWFDRGGDDLMTIVSAYVHLNPVRPGIVRLPHEYEWSSYASTIGLKRKPAWLDDNAILRVFSDDPAEAARKYQQFVESRLQASKSAWALGEKWVAAYPKSLRAYNLQQSAELLAFAATSLSRLLPSRRLGAISEVDLMLYGLSKFASAPLSLLSMILDIPKTTLHYRVQRLQSALQRNPELSRILDDAVSASTFESPLIRTEM